MRKIIAIMLAVMVSMTLSFGSVSEAKGGGSTGGYSRSSAPKASAPKASTPKTNTSGYKASSAKSSSGGNTNGYKAKSSSTAPKGSSYTTNGGGKVTSGGGNTSGYKSKQTQTKEQAQENMAKKDTDSGSSSWYGSTNNHYYGGGYDGGFGHFASGMLFGSLLSSPWHVYAGAPGYVGAYDGAPGMATGGFYSPFTGIIGVIVWFVEWAAILGLLAGLYLFAKRWWRNRRRLKYAEPK